MLRARVKEDFAHPITKAERPTGQEPRSWAGIAAEETLMNLRDVSYALRATSDLANVAERLVSSLASSRRLTGWPVLLGIGVGIGVGALLFSEDARTRVKTWLREDATRSGTKATSTASHDEAAREPAQHL